MTVSWPRVSSRLQNCGRSTLRLRLAWQQRLQSSLPPLKKKRNTMTSRRCMQHPYSLCDFRHSENSASLCAYLAPRDGAPVITCSSIPHAIDLELLVLTLNFWYCFHTPASNSGSVSSSSGFGKCAGQKMEFASRQKLGPILESGSSCHPALYLKAVQCQIF